MRSTNRAITHLRHLSKGNASRVVKKEDRYDQAVIEIRTVTKQGEWWVETLVFELNDDGGITVTGWDGDNEDREHAPYKLFEIKLPGETAPDMRDAARIGFLAFDQYTRNAFTR